MLFRLFSLIFYVRLPISLIKYLSKKSLKESSVIKVCTRFEGSEPITFLDGLIQFKFFGSIESLIQDITNESFRVAYILPKVSVGTIRN